MVVSRVVSCADYAAALKEVPRLATREIPIELISGFSRVIHLSSGIALLLGLHTGLARMHLQSPLSFGASLRSDGNVCTLQTWMFPIAPSTLSPFFPIPSLSHKLIILMFVLQKSRTNLPRLET